MDDSEIYYYMYIKHRSMDIIKKDIGIMTTLIELGVASPASYIAERQRLFMTQRRYCARNRIEYYDLYI